MLTRKEELDKDTAKILHEWYGDDPAVLFDIETTGLSRRRTQLYLIGAIARENGIWQLRQWFLDDPKEEKMLLAAFSDYLRHYSSDNDCTPRIIHFNGDTFDLPYVRSKCAIYGLPDPFTGMDSVDLYRNLRPYQHLLHLDKMRQKDLETYMGITRRDTMDGGELIHVYHTYLSSRDDSLLSLLFLHNHDDVIGMVRILPILSITALNDNRIASGVPEITDTGIRFPLHPVHPFPEVMQKQLFPLSTSLHRLKKNGTASSSRAKFPEADDVTIVLSASRETSGIYLTVPLFHGTLRHFFPNYRDYWYFPQQDAAIHKDVAVYASPEHREKARPETCYQRVTRTFCPETEEIYAPVFYREYHAFPCWFVPSAELFLDDDQRNRYIHSLLRQFTE